ncbi:hypothetical protein FIBSPDRAFT_929810 [Athelia psychrophila]|uniref:Uncharacterized protein n=1 Tax=Athelia psychrophila TaxID=1759441 RepID=A0A166N446_9AGAM|nr:hypothetical protein FIBSPDRAFT_929810 [Fibularhizoctonia sp. CBS 109695]
MAFSERRQGGSRTVPDGYEGYSFRAGQRVFLGQGPGAEEVERVGGVVQGMTIRPTLHFLVRDGRMLLEEHFHVRRRELGWLTFVQAVKLTETEEATAAATLPFVRHVPPAGAAPKVRTPQRRGLVATKAAMRDGSAGSRPRRASRGASSSAAGSRRRGACGGGSGTCCPCSWVDSITIPSSPMPVRIGTNYAPTTFERTRVEFSLTGVRQDLARLESALAHLQAVQELLQLKRDALQKYAYTHLALLSPIRRVPPEILVDIFSYFFPDDDDDATAGARRNRMLPSHICERWRNLSLSTPSFWANVCIIADEADISRKLECAQCWLARSGSCPLTVNISTTPQYLQYLGPQWKPLLDIFLPFCRKWRHASIILNETSDLSAIKNNLPMLESLKILHLTRDSPFEFAPKLYSLMTSAFDILMNANALPWNQLTVLSITVDSVQQFLAVMQKLPNVVSHTVQLFSLSPRVEEPFEYPPIRLEHLESLNMTVEPDIHITGFHECLDLPALKHYAYIEQELDTRWSLSSFLSLISRSSCALQSIDIYVASAARQNNLALLLAQTPDLESLKFNCYLSMGIISNMVLDLLLVSSSSTSRLLPKLTTVFLDYDKDFDFHLLLNMINSRWKIDGRTTGARRKTPLAKITVWNVENTDVLDHGLLECLRELKTHGSVKVILVNK